MVSAMRLTKAEEVSYSSALSHSSPCADES
jgi:hypothetical protein